MAVIKDISVNAQVSQNSSVENITATYPLVNSQPPILNWRQQLYDDEEDGNFHFLVFADKENLYYYDPFVEDYHVRPLAVGFHNIQKIAINSDRDFIFIADFLEDENLEVIYRYAILWDFNHTTDPIIYLNKTSKIR
jgi:hypothetical protein